MSYRKRKESPVIEKARKRLDGIHSLGPKVDLGNGLTAEAYAVAIQKVTTQTEAYNTMLSDLDGALVNLKKAEKELGDFSQRMLNGVGTQYGYDSVEYGKAGGTRKSNKKKPSGRRSKESNNSAA